MRERKFTDDSPAGNDLPLPPLDESAESRRGTRSLTRATRVSDLTSTGSTGPVFVAPVGNQTAAIGREVVFSCSVHNISIRKYKVTKPD
jgi:hypothetical protein